MALYKNLTDAVTFTKREDGSPVVGMKEYYQKRVAALGKKYAVRIPAVGRTGRCPLHDDEGPSFGILVGRDGRERFNCFGCHERGHVVDLHRKFELKWNKRNLSLDEAAKDLLSVFREDISVFEAMLAGGTAVQAEQLSEAQIRARKRQADMDAVRKSYTAKRYEQDIAKGVVEGRDNAYFNALMYRRMVHVL